MPTLYQDGREIRPAKGQFYYNLRGYERMAPFPAGLKMVAGQARPVTVQSTDVVWWACGGSGGARSRKFVRVPAHCGTIHMTYHGRTRKCPTCPLVPTTFENDARTYLELHVNFPDCWDGRHLDSPNHRSHMAYSRNDVACLPPGKVPRSAMIATRRDVAASRSPPAGSSGSADFFNAWNQTALAHVVTSLQTGLQRPRRTDRLAARQPPCPPAYLISTADTVFHRQAAWTQTRAVALPGGHRCLEADQEVDAPPLARVQEIIAAIEPLPPASRPASRTF